MNVKYFRILLAIVLSGFSVSDFQAQTCLPAPVGLIASYSGDGDTLDARSRYNGTIQNGVNYTAGKVGQAFNLAGNSGDRVLLGNTPDLRRQNFTIEAWVKRSSSSVVTNSPAGGSPNGSFFAFGQNGYAFLIQEGTGKLGLSAVGQSQVLTNTLAITDTNWHHVAVTVSGPAFTAGTQTIFYLDGVAETTGYAPFYGFPTNAAIGSRGDGVTTNAFFGAVDELSIYDRPLAATEITAIFAADTVGKCKPLATNAPDNQVLWLAGDGDANDISGNGNNGILQNGATFQAGKVGQGFTLDGADDVISVPNSASLNFAQTAPMSVEMWVYRTSSAPIQHFIGKRFAGCVPNFNYQIALNNTSGQGLTFGGAAAAGGVEANSGQDLPLNTWTHLAGTSDGTTIRFYINGVLASSAAGTLGTPNSEPLVVGGSSSCQTFGGKIDETSIYQRTLSATEIQSIVNAGLAGKYKVQATVPANIAAWYPGDGNTNDLQAGNTATLQGGATYVNGKVGQAFSLNGTSYVSAPSTPANDPTGATGASMEAWVYFNQRPSDAGRPFWIISKDGPTFGSSSAFHLRTDTDNGIKFQWQGGGVGNSSNFTLQTGVWYHVVGTYSPTEPVCKMYINGVFQGSGACTSTPRSPSNLPLEIGRYSGNNTANFNGLIDEPAIYNRTLTEAEIRDQYYAGSLGKYKGAANPTVQNTTKTGDATVTFGTLTTAGSVHQTPLDAALLPALPMGTNTGLNYDISTSAVYTNPTVCLNMSSFTPAQFANLRIYHLESGIWQNRTSGANSYPNLCTAGLTSLSPFAIASVAPTAANATISGRVRDGKNGLSNVVVRISGGNLTQPISVKTNNFGSYKFANLSVGETYVLTVASKKYYFPQATKIVNLLDEISDFDFEAETEN